MKTTARTAFLVLGAILIIALSAFAAETRTIPVTLNNPTVVNGTSLKPGDYRMVVTMNGSDVKAVFLDKEKKEVANADGTFATQQHFPTPVSVVVSDVNGSRTLREVWVSKLKGSITFASNAKVDNSKQ